MRRSCLNLISRALSYSSVWINFVSNHDAARARTVSTGSLVFGGGRRLIRNDDFSPLFILFLDRVEVTTVTILTKMPDGNIIRNDCRDSIDKNKLFQRSFLFRKSSFLVYSMIMMICRIDAPGGLKKKTARSIVITVNRGT